MGNKGNEFVYDLNKAKKVQILVVLVFAGFVCLRRINQRSLLSVNTNGDSSHVLSLPLSLPSRTCSCTPAPSLAWYYIIAPTDDVHELTYTLTLPVCLSVPRSLPTPPPFFQGHLPLTSALRGVYLLKSLLQHPAFGNEGSGIKT